MTGPQAQPGQVVDHHLAAADPGADPLRRGLIADHFAGADRNAPGGEQRLERGDRVALGVGHRVHAATRGHHLGERVDEGQHAAAAHHELIDRVERGGVDIVRLGEHQHRDVVVDRALLAAEEADVEELVHRLQHLPRLEAIELAAHQRQVAEHRDRGLVRVGEIADQPGEVVLEKVRPLRREIADRLEVVGRVAPGQAEIGERAVVADRQAVQALGDREILLGRERLRIEALDPDLAAGQPLIGREQLLDALRMAAEIRPELVELRGVVEAQVDRLVDLPQHLLGAFRQREQAILGQIEPGRGEPGVGQQVEREEQDHRKADADQAEPVALHG